MRLYLYDFLHNWLGITADAVILNHGGDVLAKHLSKNYAKDDVDEKLWKREVQVVTIDLERFPNALVVYLKD